MTRQFTTAPPALGVAEICISVPWRNPDLACTCPAWCHRLIVVRGVAVFGAGAQIVALTTDTKAASAAARLLSGDALAAREEWRREIQGEWIMPDRGVRR